VTDPHPQAVELEIHPLFVNRDAQDIGEILLQVEIMIPLAQVDADAGIPQFGELRRRRLEFRADPGPPPEPEIEEITGDDQAVHPLRPAGGTGRPLAGGKGDLAAEDVVQKAQDQGVCRLLAILEVGVGNEQCLHEAPFAETGRTDRSRCCLSNLPNRVNETSLLQPGV